MVSRVQYLNYRYEYEYSRAIPSLSACSLEHHGKLGIEVRRCFGDENYSEKRKCTQVGIV